MKEIDYILLAEGRSDKALLPIIDWLLEELFPEIPKNGEFVNPSILPSKKLGLAKAISTALLAYPNSNVIFVHRDADKVGLKNRQQEVIKEIKQAGLEIFAIPVVPVKMTEAWLMVSESALRNAANNPRGSDTIDFPRLKQLESLAKPKQKLEQLLRQASELSGRRLKGLNINHCKHRISGFLLPSDFESLRKLKSFAAFEEAIQNTIKL